MKISTAVSFLRVAGGTILTTLLLTTFGGQFLAMLDARIPFRLPAMLQWLGWSIIIGAFALIASAEYTFLTRGQATGTPNDPPRRLVIAGPYRWMRNPLYVSGIAILWGIAFVQTSPSVLLFALIVIPAFYLFVVRFEEPRLEKGFGEEYRAYKRQVPRWIPRKPR